MMSMLASLPPASSRARGRRSTGRDPPPATIRTPAFEDAGGARWSSSGAASSTSHRVRVVEIIRASSVPVSPVDRTVSAVDRLDQQLRGRIEMTHRQKISLMSVFLTLFSCQGPPPRTVVAEPSLEDRAASAGWHGGRPWMEQHLDGVKIAARGNLDLLLVGDSITQSWGGEGRRVGVTAAGVFERFFGQLRVGNLGISGDRTQHLLWRIENGTLDGADPAVIVILIGTNNITHDPPAEIALGIESVVKATRNKAPDALILLHPILPRGTTAADQGRQDCAEVNAAIGHLGELQAVEILDLTDVFLAADQELHTHLYRPDALHLSPAGYEAWARALAPRLRLAGLAVAKRP
ncbi:MAG TPA: hypothetical protein EYF93_05445 [Planctomycetes bacterium]|nr:hypothetical protein [Planctomycetota bacterium]